MDRPWKIDWNGGQIVIHASTADEATTKVLEYLRAMNPFRVTAIQEEGGAPAQADVELPPSGSHLR